LERRMRYEKVHMTQNTGHIPSSNTSSKQRLRQREGIWHIWHNEDRRWRREDTEHIPVPKQRMNDNDNDNDIRVEE